MVLCSVFRHFHHMPQLPGETEGLSKTKSVKDSSMFFPRQDQTLMVGNPMVLYLPIGPHRHYWPATFPNWNTRTEQSFQMHHSLCIWLVIIYWHESSPAPGSCVQKCANQIKGEAILVFHLEKSRMDLARPNHTLESDRSFDNLLLPESHPWTISSLSFVIVLPTVFFFFFNYPGDSHV